MSDYTLQVSWSGKDALADTDPAKIISGDDFNTEFSAIATASATKMDKSSNLLDVSSASVSRTNLGVAIGSDVQAYDVNNAVTNVSQEFTATQNFNATTLTDGATISWDASVNQVTSVTLAGNRTMAAPTNLVDGAFYSLTVVQDATGSRTLTWNGVFKWPSATAPTLTTTASARDEFVFKSDGTNMYLTGQSLSVGTA